MLFRRFVSCVLSFSLLTSSFLGFFLFSAVGVNAALVDAYTPVHTYAINYTDASSIQDDGYEQNQSMFATRFTTGSDITTLQAILETGGSGTGIFIAINNGNLEVYIGGGNNLELSTPISANTTYTILLYADKDLDLLELYTSTTATSINDIDSTNSSKVTNNTWTDTDWDGGNNMGVYLAAGSIQGSFSGTNPFLGTPLEGVSVYNGQTPAIGNIPTINLIGSSLISQEVGTSYTDAGAEYDDVEDGTGSIVGVGTVDTSTVGVYTINYDFTDSSGNNAERVTRTINITSGSPLIINNSLPIITSTETDFEVGVGETIITTIEATDVDSENVVMQYGTTTVTGTDWKNIPHSQMCEPIAVGSSRNDVDGLNQSVVRLNNKTTSSFDIKIDNQAGSIPTNQVSQVDWIVTNSGSQVFTDDGGNDFQIQAGSKLTPTLYARACPVSATPESVLFSPVFTANPVVIHSISSNNGLTSVASTVNGNDGSVASEPTTTAMGFMMQEALGLCTAHPAENIDYIAMEPGHFTFGGNEIDAVRSTDTIAAVTATGNPVTFSSAFAEAPKTLLVSLLGLDGGDGGHANVHSEGTTTTTTFQATIDEDDDVAGTSRGHTTEIVAAAAFESGNGIVTETNILTYSISGGDDAGFFTISSTGGLLTFVSGQDGNTLADTNSDAIYEVEVQVCDSHCSVGCDTQSIVVEVQGAPTDIALSNDNLDENISDNSLVGTFSAIDINSSDSHTYSFVSGSGDDDNSEFSISGNTLRINSSPDFEIQDTYSVRVRTDDGNGNTYDEIFVITINDLDEEPPVITLTGSGTINIIKNTIYSDLGATCNDGVDADCAVIVGGATVNTSVLGSYIITYDASDAVGNNAVQVTRTVNVIAGDVPVITRIGNSPLNIEVFSTYTDSGSTASDSEDGDITGDIVTVDPVDTSTLGTYLVSYNVSDSSDNDAIEVLRTVNVTDSVVPVITRTGSGIISVVKNASYSDAGGTALDNFDGDITADIITANPVDTSVLGTYAVRYNVSDSSGNSATQVTRTVNVVSGNAPVISLLGSGTLSVEANSVYSDAGATASDSEDGDISGDIVTVNPVDTSTLGTYSVTYNVTDSSDNTASEKIRTINVVDTIAPVISLSGNGSINLTQGESFTDPGATCSDNYDANCSVNVSGDIVDTTRVGTYVIAYDALDVSGNNASQVMRTVIVSAANILINEVEYDTAGNEAESEWFELYNPTSGIVNIENWTITEKVGASNSKTYTFPSLEVAAGGYVVITNETTDFQVLYPGVTPDLDLPGSSFFSLKNTPSDELELKDPSGNPIDYVAWENTGDDWGLFASEVPICRLLTADTDTSADWSDTCVATPGAANEFNAIPTDIEISSDSIDENNAASASVGTFTTTDADVGDSHTYSLVSGTGDDNNASFSISGNTLSITPATNYELQQSYNIRVATNDGNGGIYEESFTISVNDLNTTPSDIELSSTTIDENNASGDTIGVLSGTDDGEDSNTLLYSLSCLTPGLDDASFSISGTNLNAAQSYNFEDKDEYSICIRVTDGVLTYDENFTININNLDEIPPVVVISSITKLQNSSITDTTIQIIDDVAVDSSDISIGTGSTLTASSLNCTQTSTTQVDCSISIDSSGDLVINALDSSSNLASDSETNYIIDTVAPNVPNVSVDTTGGNSVDNPEITFSSLDNIGVDYYEVTYYADDGGAGTGTLTTLSPTTSPLSLVLDSDEVVHTIIVTVYDAAGNSSSTTVKFPPIITFSAPTTLSNTTITDSTVTIMSPLGHSLTGVTLAPGTTSASLGTCTDAASGTSAPYASPVTCIINNISASGSISVSAEDVVNGAQGLNSQSYVIDTTNPIITITAPTKQDNTSITDTTISVTDETAIDVSDISLDGSTTLVSSSFLCVQTSLIRVDCTVDIDDSGNLVISASDIAGNNLTETEADYIIDTIAPVLSLVTPSPETIEYLSSYTDGGAIFTDNIDGTGALIGVGSVNTGVLGSYSLDYDYTDIAGNTGATISRTIQVVDTTIPVISLIGSGVTIEVNSSYSDAGASAVDNFDGDISANINATGSVDTATIGTYIVSYDVTDSNGNIADQVTRTIEVVDTTIPVITLSGSDEIVLEVGDTYSELGATVSDNYYTLLAGDISIDSSDVNTSIVGDYTVVYNVSDGSGNAATQVERMVTVVDTTSPIITLTGTGVTVEVNTSYSDAGATASDNYDGNLSSSISTVNPVDITEIGTYIVSYDVIDSSGNSATQVTRNVEVVDTTSPIITLTGTGVTVEVNTSYSDAGATASDNYDGNLSSSISTVNPVDITEIGTYIVSYDVIDSSGNSATQVTRNVEVVDTTSPIISLIGSSSLNIYKNDSYTEFGASCSDNYDANCSVTIGGQTVDTSTLGTYVVSYDVTDAQGNVATQLTRNVNVISGDTPVITLTGSGNIVLEVNSNYIDLGATASDAEQGNMTSNIVVVNPVDINEIGTYTVTFNLTDSSDNVATQVTRTVEIVDTTVPIINLTGSGTITLFKNATYTEFGAVCGDNYDTNCSVTISGDTVDTSTEGVYTVNYDVTDAQGNIATQITRTVNVILGDTPEITLTGSGTIYHEVYTSYVDSGATAIDTEDGNITNSISTVNPVNTNTLGIYTVTYDVTDFSGNTATGVTRTVIVEDTIAPTIALTGSANITLYKNSNYPESGSTCSDNYDAVCTVSIAGDSVDTSALGTYTVTYDVIDSEGNVATQVTRNVSVISGDTPVISLLGDSVVTVEIGDSYSDAGAIANDTEEGDLSYKISTVNPVNTSDLGSYVIRYNVIDFSENVANEVTRTVNVVDTTPPVITLSGSTLQTVKLGESYIDAGAFCNDNLDLSCSVITNNPVDINTLGTYIVTYNAVDTNLNIATEVARTVQVITGDIPAITLIGNASEIVEINTSYSDVGATAFDTEDGDLSANIVTVNPVDVSTLGAYTIRYNVIDSNLNNAIEIIRTVQVVDDASDGDGDGVPDLIEIEQGSNPLDTNDFLDTDGDLQPNYTDPDDDGDGSVDGIEASSPNDGDFNGDGQKDVLQQDVATIINPLISNFTSLDTTIGSCGSTSFSMVSEQGLEVQDNESSYPIGLADYNLECANPGDTANIKIYLDRQYDVSDWVYKKYNSSTNVYTDISSSVIYTTENISGNVVTVINYSITDGGFLDEDGIENGIIIDPSGPSIVAGGSSGRVNYDKCDGIDTSGSIFDGSCGDTFFIEDEEEFDIVIETKDDSKNIVEPSKGDDYVVPNDFAYCSIIQDINNDFYEYDLGTFSDLDQTKFSQEILKFADIGIVDGYKDGTFGPSNLMTRSEFLKVALISHCYDYSTQNTIDLDYLDVDKNSWQAKVISKATELGMVDGDIDTNGGKVFRPNDIISKAEAVKILLKLSLIQSHNPGFLGYRDIQVGWHESYIINGEALGLFDAEKDKGYFYPENGVKREYMIDLINRLVHLYK